MAETSGASSPHDAELQAPDEATRGRSGRLGVMALFRKSADVFRPAPAGDPHDAQRFDRETQLVVDVQKAYLDVARTSLDRSLLRANVVAGAAGAVGTVYGGILGLVFSQAKSNSGLAPRAIVPSIFLGLSLLSAAIYAAFLRNQASEIRGQLIPTGTGPEIANTRLDTFLAFMDEGVATRGWAMRFAVVNLGLGVALFPMPFIKLRGVVAPQILIITASATAALWLIGEWGSSVRDGRAKVTEGFLQELVGDPLLSENVDLDVNRLRGVNSNLLGAKDLLDVVRAATLGCDVAPWARTNFDEITLARTRAYLDALTNGFEVLQRLKDGNMVPRTLREQTLLGSPTMLIALAAVYRTLRQKEGNTSRFRRSSSNSSPSYYFR